MYINEYNQQYKVIFNVQSNEEKKEDYQLCCHKMFSFRFFIHIYVLLPYIELFAVLVYHQNCK